MFKPIKYRAHNSYDTREASDAAVSPMSGQSLTIASQAEDTDINVIVRRMTSSGIMPRMAAKVPEYGDYSNATDYRSALHIIMEAEESFSALDAKVRNRFENDPQLFLEFCSNPANIDELAKMGLARDGYTNRSADDGSSKGTGKVSGGKAGAPAQGPPGDGNAAPGGSGSG